MSTLTETARAWYEHGATPLPVWPDGQKRPRVEAWKHWQKTRPSPDQLARIFGVDHDGIGVVTGAISGNLEMLEIEGRAVAEGTLTRLAQAFADHGREDLWTTITSGYSEITPSGGMHWYYRTPGPALSTRPLARRPATPDELERDPNRYRVLIETRAEGGFSVTAPSGGRTHPTGKPYVAIAGSPRSIPTISDDDRDFVHDMCRLLDQVPAPTPAPSTPRPLPRATPSDDDSLRPGDDFNRRADWADIIGTHGWVVKERSGHTTYWTRPGKDTRDGVSATTGHSDDGEDRLYVFSTSTDFDPEVPYSKFSAYALLEHGGDHSAAARALREKGYGAQRDDEEPLDQLAGLLSQPTVTGPVLDPDHSQPDPFWDARPILRHIHTFALSRLSAPSAVLATILARTLQTIPPAYVLPPVIGGDGSLNLLLALVGPSGSGKGAAMAAARGAVMFPGAGEPHIVTIGSGEGIAHQYAKITKGGFEWIRRDVLFETSEIDSVAAISGRQGSTLMEQLRKAFSGEPLGFAYASAEKRILIPAHSYRFGFVAGVQPEKSQALLGDADGGTPQRFVWTSVTDSAITAEPVTTPDPWVLDMPPWKVHEHERSPEGRHIIAIPDTVAQQLRAARVQALRGEDNPLDGHRLFVQEKVAVAFAILDSRHHVNEEDWELAGRLMLLSDRTREHCQRTLQRKSQEAMQARIVSRVKAETMAAEDVEADRVERCATAILAKLERDGGQASQSDIKRALNQKTRAAFDDAIVLLLERRKVLVEGDEHRLVVTAVKP